MKVLHVEVDSCFHCPYLKTNSMGCCRNVFFCGKIARTIYQETPDLDFYENMKEEMKKLKALPDWCPLPDKGEKQ